ncbi:hypothetical protein CHS0354_029895 [Potamilus streckersoni]|uniref:RNA (guanine-9-)-methyltransferase domain-containing protein 1 n=1 Tax=Potamilus streckersoni TaxID=2493646 RepID=A0AAE0RT10_9BIVA|nr:hypothetical protein CHS0354_029895 [Potamilus streckersoni]
MAIRILLRKISLGHPASVNPLVLAIPSSTHCLSWSPLVIKDDSEDSCKKPSAQERIHMFNSEEQKKLHYLKLEYELIKIKRPHKVPQVMTDDIWLELHEMPSFTKRLKYLMHHSTKERRKEKEQLKKRERLEVLKNRMESEIRKFPIISERMIDEFNKKKLCNAMLYNSPTIVFDMGYEDMMIPKEIKSLIYQLNMCYSNNKRAITPFNMIACNINPNGLYCKLLKKVEGTHCDSSFLERTEKHYLELFPCEKLVYLTPNSPNLLEKFNGEDVIIIGGLVDTHGQKPASFARATSDNLRTAKLPLDKYLRWGCGNKNLTLDQVFNILLELHWSGDWHKAFRHVPMRKVKGIR